MGHVHRSRIAVFLPSLVGGGAERVMLSLARGFSDRQLGVDLVLAKAEGVYLAEVPSTVRVLDLGAQRVLGALPALVRYLREERPVAMISALDHANIVALWARWMARVQTKVVVSVRSTLSQATANASSVRERLLPFLDALFYPWADGIVAVSEGVKEDLISLTRLEPERVRVIYNPVITPQLVAKAEAAVEHPWFAPGAPPVVLSAGRLTKAKDFATLIRAFALLSKRHSARLVILGEGEERAQLERLVHELGLQDKVALPGFVENPWAYMKRAALFVLSSRWEGLGNVLIEALAVGTPVVATDCRSGPREILEDGRWGRLVPVGDVEALASAMEAALLEPDRELLKVAQRRVRERFSLDASVAAYLELLGIEG